MMESISGGIALVAFLTIFIMLLLCIDVITSSFRLINSQKVESLTQVEHITVNYEKNHDKINHDKKLVYPFYVDYSRSIDPHQKYSSTT
jgi:hypothetical protein